MKTCKMHSATPSNLAPEGEVYYLCGNPVKYYIKYKSPIRGEIIEKKVCGVHFRSIEKGLKNNGRDFIEEEAL